MVPGYAQAYLAVDLEAAGGRQEAEGGGAERILRWEDDAPVVDAVCVGGGGGPEEREVPFEEGGVGEGGRVEVGRGVGGGGG
jgi:hypothetical protein